MTNGSRPYVVPRPNAPAGGAAKAEAAPPADPAPPAGPAPSDGAPRDAFMDRLGDRLSEQQALPDAKPPTSDVHSLPATDTPSEEDDALDFPPPSTGNTVDPFADFEDELEGENTRIDDSHLLAEQSTVMLEDAPAQPFLAVEKGNDLGREFVIQRGENGIGRGIDNDVILADVAVSRRHLQVFLEEGDVLRLKDLGSGNGTQVNGRKVGTVVLNEGDRIEVGETILVVRTPNGAVAPAEPYQGGGEHTDENLIGSSLPAPAPSSADPLSAAGPGYQPEHTPSATDVARIEPSKPGAVTIPKGVLIGVVAAGAIFLALFGGIVTLLVVTSGGEEQSAEAEASAFDRGVASYNAGELDDAESAMQEAEEEGADEAPVYLSRIREAREHARELRAAQAASDSRAWEDVVTHTGNIPSDSPFATDSEPLRVRAIAQMVSGHVQASRRAVEAGDIATARHELGQAEVLDPSADLDRLRQQIAALAGPEGATAEAATEGETEESPSAEEEPVVEAVPNATEEGDTSTATRPGRRGTPTRVPRRTRRGPDPMPAIISQYLRGEFSAAARAATEASRSVPRSERARYTRISRDITTFGRLWGQITRGRFGSGVRNQMSTAMATDQRISRNSQYRDRIRPRYVEAMVAHARGQSSPPARCATVRAIAGMARNNGAVRQMSARCETEARGMLAEARRQRGSAAVSTYTRAMAMVPPSSPVYRQARQARDAASRTSVMDEDGN